MKDTEIAKTFCFYNIKERPESIKNLFLYFEPMAEKFAYPWGSLGAGGRQKLLQFKTGKRKLEKINFETENHVSLLGGVDEPGTNSNWKLNFSIDFGQYSRCLYFCYPADFDIDHHAFGLELMKNVSQFCDYEYGIGFERRYVWGPDMYCGGTIYTGSRLEVSDFERNQIGAWMRKYALPSGKYQVGDFRDIYSYNMLTEPHLIRQVGSKSLKDWILSNPAHGTLEKVTDRHWLWSIDPEQIPTIQEALEPTGILLCYKPK